MKFLSHDGLMYFWEQVKNYVDTKCSQAGGAYVGGTAPSNTKMLWIDTANGGILKYYNGSSWVATKSVWG